ncbi:transmembrane protein, putative (macronuclear) [Tetrahymena thermophila SB210]|uniref:Transmembrane protein, putative n=1 Tax=Tetrahymena thermophila (strain SB210) TaxID=312017 RepID=W7WXM1_TETTS|nr:transmembrane protein, putative [Tetrahymena thermophila SB210]EWS71580.1 transmembrane protein, putative [Tetrahymena thermophila SB210]|eukprot:XP_012655884.1 transmembrane protein, putative [Tetrahymena thermophila SB210]
MEIRQVTVVDRYIIRNLLISQIGSEKRQKQIYNKIKEWNIQWILYLKKENQWKLSFDKNQFVSQKDKKLGIHGDQQGIFFTFQLIKLSILYYYYCYYYKIILFLFINYINVNMTDSTIF